MLGLNPSLEDPPDSEYGSKQMTDKEYRKAISFLTVSFQFFSLVQNSFDETIFQGNDWLIISDEEIDFEEYESKTKWSDHKIIIPLLFNFYHGLELLLKGLLQFDATFELKIKHSIEGLSARFIKDNPTEKEICDFLKKYTHLGELPKLLKQFLSTNNLSVNKLYEALRYPTDPSFSQIRDYLCIKDKGEEGIQFFKELLAEIGKARIAAVSYGRVNKPN